MLFETLSQPKLLLLFIIFGFLSGFVFDISNFIKVLTKNNKVINIILDFVSTIINALVLFVVNLYFNYGEIRLFAIAIFELGFTIQRLTLGKIFAKFFILLYNLVLKILKKLKNLFKKKQKDSKI